MHPAGSYGKVWICPLSSWPFFGDCSHAFKAGLSIDISVLPTLFSFETIVLGMSLLVYPVSNWNKGNLLIPHTIPVGVVSWSCLGAQEHATWYVLLVSTLLVGLLLASARRYLRVSNLSLNHFSSTWTLLNIPSYCQGLFNMATPKSIFSMQK
jgi:hypothetical protein